MASSTNSSGVAHIANTDLGSKTTVKIVLGAMTLGKKGTEVARVHDLRDFTIMLDMLQKSGYNEVDTARIYGASEELLGQLDWKGRDIVMGTKLSPRRSGPNPYSHKTKDLQRGLTDSLQALQTDTVDLWYLHMPDHDTPYKETLQAVNDLYKAGLFKRFGISSYAAWEVAQICELCIQNGWKMPDVYQGSYNALQRSAEPELFPCLRAYGIAFYAFSPLAGGMLTDKYERDTTQHEPGSRFDPAKAQGRGFRGMYWNESCFAALDIVRPVAQKLGLTTSEAALRWLSHHSSLKDDGLDAIIVGASSAKQLETNLTSLENGALPDELVKAFDEAWMVVKGTCGPYHR
ncbi:aldo/keto reductase [Cryphonectria parasitica EP155]|uniref:Aldo/keto reductase n=1 Tax=Cryphonectria parasitica (strain ATCC 38755 / EP155) TaxID=660469 RepID=A0A9P4XWK8_CRYP1|nr:aldo/keto reductase [Cryphonectria parasitica EP155]KAF3762100.1 aldo/keto reductase [Cryphonectria parasitica EP155]